MSRAPTLIDNPKKRNARSRQAETNTTFLFVYLRYSERFPSIVCSIPSPLCFHQLLPFAMSYVMTKCRSLKSMFRSVNSLKNCLFFSSAHFSENRSGYITQAA